THIPSGTRARNVPGPGETMQSFETAEDFVARTEWNDLQPRLGRPQVMDRAGAGTATEVYLSGTATNLKKGDALLLAVGQNKADRVLRFVASVELQEDADRTKVTLEARGLSAVLLPAVHATIAEARASVPQGATASKALDVLDELEAQIARAASPDEIGEH